MNSLDNKSGCQKVFVVDTNVLMVDHRALRVLGGGKRKDGVISDQSENTVVISIFVIEELDHLKSADGDKGASAREAIREINRVKDECPDNNICVGLKMSTGGVLRIDIDGKDETSVPTPLVDRSTDNMLLALCLRLMESCPKSQVIFITKDLNLRLKASAYKIEAQDYESGMVPDPIDKMYTGLSEVSVLPGTFRVLNAKGFVSFGESMSHPGGCELVDNMCCRLVETNSGNNNLAICNLKEGLFSLVRKHNVLKISGKMKVSPRNEGQSFAYALAMDKRIKLLTLLGKAGTGKSLMALLAACQRTVGEERLKDFKKIMVFRPTLEVGEPLGFLPGTIDEKFEPWMRPVITSLDLIFGDSTSYREFVESRTIEILPINFIRGDTFNDCVIILDEAQNYSPRAIKAAITRAGVGSMVILTGDLTQTDEIGPFDPRSSGLAHVIKAFKGQDMYGHMTLVKGERSDLSELASQIL